MSQVTDITSYDQFEGIVMDKSSSKRYVVVDFYGQRCDPCEKFEPVFANLSEKYPDDVHFLKVDFKKVVDLSVDYAVEKVPTFMFFEVGSTDPIEDYTVIGIGKTEAHIKTTLDRLLGKQTLNITDDF